MQTGWEHDDHQSRREFERLRNRTSESTEGAEETPSLRRGRPISSSPAPDQGPLGIRSPLETIEVDVNASWWEIDRHFRVWVNGSPVEVRDNGETATVKDIHFDDTASVTWTVVRRGLDSVTVTAVSSGGGGGTYDWDIAGNTGGPSTVANGDQVNIVGGTNISTVLTGTGPYTLTINNTAPTYNWEVGVSGASKGPVIAGEDVYILGTGTVASSYMYFGGVHYVTLLGRLTIEDDNVAVGGTDTIFLNFDSQAETTTAQAVNFVVTDDGAGQRSVKAYVPASAGSYEWYIDDNTSGFPATVANGDTVDIIGGTDIVVNRTGRSITIANNYAYSWFVNVDGGTNTEISDGEEVNFISGTDINIVRVGNNITINSTAVAASYDWDLQADTGGPSTVGTGALVDIAGGTGVDTALTGAGPFTVTINRPFTIEDDNVAVGGGDTLYLNFDSQAETTTAQAVNFVVTDDGTGQRSVKAYVPASGGSYDWDLQADTGGPSTIGSGAIVDIAGGIGVTTTLAGAGPYVVTIDRPLTIEDDNVAVGGTDTLFINFDSNSETTTAQAVNFVVTDDGAGQRTIRGFVPASGGSYDWTVAADSGSELVTSGSTITWAGGTHITTSYDPGTNTVTITADPYPDYNWLLAAGGVAGTENITDGETVTFNARGPQFSVDRTTNNITYTHIPNGPDDGGYENPSGGRILTGYVEWNLTGVVAPTDYKYGVKKSVDIVHNWDLLNMHMWELYLEDVTIQEDYTDLGYGVDKDYYRDGAVTMAGETLPNQYVRLKPYVQAHDSNTIRLWITHSRNFPTVMKMWYVLREA